jgi:hypothetical protein
VHLVTMAREVSRITANNGLRAGRQAATIPMFCSMLFWTKYKFVEGIVRRAVDPGLEGGFHYCAKHTHFRRVEARKRVEEREKGRRRL